MSEEKFSNHAYGDNSIGFIFLHRKIFDNKYYYSQPFTKSSAWIDLLLLANFHDGYLEVRGIGLQVKRGQLAYSRENLARRWRWSTGKVNRYLSKLKVDGQINFQNSNVTTLITILNYDLYQKPDMQMVVQTSSRQNPSGRHTNKVNKVNKEIETRLHDGVKEIDIIKSENGPKKQDVRPEWAKNFINYNPVIKYPCEDETFALIWDRWITYRNEKKVTSYVPTSEEAAINNLYDMAECNIDMAYKIVNYSISRNWKSLNPPRNESKSSADYKPMDPDEAVKKILAGK